MNNKISPKYQMQLINDIDKRIWSVYSTYQKVEGYVDKWHEGGDWNNNWENFYIYKKKSKENDNEVIDLYRTLNNIDGETLLKIAIDLGLETPDFIPSIPKFRNAIKSSYKTASQTFEKAFRQIEEHPETAIGLVNSALESIVKEILKDDILSTKLDNKKTLYDLTSDILKEFQMFPNGDMPKEIRNIGSALLKISQNIEKIRSDKTDFHGKTNEDYVVNDPLYAYFVVNCITTVGMFLKSFYKTKFLQLKQSQQQIEDDDDLPF